MINTSYSTDTEQTVRDSSGRFAKGSKPSNGFDKRPQDRSNGCWKRSESARGKLEKIITLTEDELLRVSKDKNAPMFERKLADIILDASWPVLRDIMDQVYGKPKESVDLNSTVDSGPLIKGFVIPTLPEDFIQLDKKS